MKSARIRCACLVAIFAVLTSTSTAQLEAPFPAPVGHPLAVSLYRGSPDSVYWIALADSLLSQVFQSELHKSVLYFGAGGPDASSHTLAILDSTLRHVSFESVAEIDLYSTALARGQTGAVAAAWTRQRFYGTDILYPKRLGSPELRCVFLGPGPVRADCRIDHADHPSAVMGDQDQVHLVFESVTPFPSAALLNPARDTSYYFVTSQLEYRVLQRDGEIDSLASFTGGFRPSLHRDRSGSYHLFWLQGDSSNSATFRLRYSRDPGTPAATMSELSCPLRAVEEYTLNRHPPIFSSFVDDSGRVSVGWIDGRTYLDGRIYFARFLPDGTWTVDSLGNQPLWGSQPTFRMDRFGRGHVLWQTYDGTNAWTLHYSSSAFHEHLFSVQRSYKSPFAYAEPPVMVIDSRGVANAAFSDGPPGIGYLRSLAAGPDTVLHVSPGSSIAYGGVLSPVSHAVESSVIIDDADQLWLVRSNNGLALLVLDRTFTGLDESASTFPTGFSLSQNYPNPFNPTTGIRYQVPGASDVNVAVYDLLGREVAVLVNERKAAGSYEARFDASGLSSGIYFYRLSAGPSVQSRKMVVLK